ncbi:hypothetical protein BBP40_004766 [Aspergillus hancockii]|nr:hypothetical protein BBP40_004766 [Aspergillus hancockii]
MLALDPAILIDSALSDEEDSDYEYEYDEQETETFYLNLDLTTSHGPIRAPRRRHDPTATTSSTAATPGPSSASVPPSRSDDNEPTLASTEVDNTLAERVQILGLHTHNPIISYQNQIFSCSWADQIGTELLFSRADFESQPGPQPESEVAAPRVIPLKRGKDFDLLAANSVKVLGRRANLISSAGPAQNFPHPDAALDVTAGANRRVTTQTNQALFLDRLKGIKRIRGETDAVRTIFSLKRAQNLDDRLRGWARTEEQLAEIQRLNDAALQGNSDAITELENLYKQLETQESALFEDSFQQR